MSKELINNLSYAYGIDDLTMQGIVRDSLNERGLIDKNELRKMPETIINLNKVVDFRL